MGLFITISVYKQNYYFFYFKKLKNPTVLRFCLFLKKKTNFIFLFSNFFKTKAKIDLNRHKIPNNSCIYHFVFYNIHQLYVIHHYVTLV
jgi:hypothetical protein